MKGTIEYSWIGHQSHQLISGYNDLIGMVVNRFDDSEKKIIISLKENKLFQPDPAGSVLMSLSFIWIQLLVFIIHELPL